jgi:hypothetical protein
MTSLLPIALGGASGLVYFSVAENHVGAANCSWRDPLSTDLASLAVGGFLAWRGSTIGAPWVAAAGAAIIAIHLSQLAFQGPGDSQS